jgi:putative transposase
MTEYRRAYAPGATWFFTVNLAQRKDNRLLVERFDDLREAFNHVRACHSFRTDALVVLPDHLHCIWKLPPGDTDFSTRWGLIKARFSRAVEEGERRSASRLARGERGLWQRRFWEHLVRDQDDFNRHVDYIHWNLVKHGWVRRVCDWPNSTFHEYVKRGVYPLNWGGDGVADLKLVAGE